MRFGHEEKQQQPQSYHIAYATSREYIEEDSIAFHDEVRV